MTEPEVPQDSTNEKPAKSITSSTDVSLWDVFSKAVVDAATTVDRVTYDANKVIQDTAANLNDSLNAINTISTQTGEAISKTVDNINTALQEVVPQASVFHTRAQEVGGGFAGAIAGEAVGGVIGSIAGTAVLGPVGTILGSQMGGFIGFVVGAHVGEEVIINLNQFAQKTPKTSASFGEKLQTSLQVRGGDRIGDTVGAIAGGLVGTVVLGPSGALIGSSIGGAFVGRLAEDTVISLNKLGKPENIPKTQPTNIDQTVTTWFGSATSEFVGETMTMTVGSIVGGVVLGPTGRRIGREFGNFVGKKIDWDLNPIKTLPFSSLSQPSTEAQVDQSAVNNQYQPSP